MSEEWSAVRDRERSWISRATRFLEDLTGLIETAVLCMKAMGRLTHTIAWTLAGIVLILFVVRGL